MLSDCITVCFGSSQDITALMLLCPIGGCVCVRVCVREKQNHEMLLGKVPWDCATLLFIFFNLPFFFFFISGCLLTVPSAKGFLLTILTGACAWQQTTKGHVWWQTAGCNQKKGSLRSFFYFHPQAFMTLFILTDVAATFRWSGTSAVIPFASFHCFILISSKVNPSALFWQQWTSI